MHAAIVVQNDNGLLGLFESRKLAEDSIKYSYHTIKGMQYESGRCSFIAIRPDGQEDSFEVREQIINNSVVHL